MLMPVWTPLILVHEGTERRRTDSTRPRNGGAAPSPPRPASTPAVVVVVHEEADSGMLRVPIRCTVRACSNLSAVYHREAEGGKKEEVDRGGTILEGGGRNRFIAPPLALFNLLFHVFGKTLRYFDTRSVSEQASFLLP